MFKETEEGKTHSFNDGCGEPAHNSEETILKEKCGHETIIRKICRQNLPCNKHNTMDKEQPHTQGWEERFEKRYGDKTMRIFDDVNIDWIPGDIKSFIRQVESDTRA